ncbi:MAG: tRNA (adenosine(37)-N6)-dimethylallyltransferase MiaA [Lachnospiraceae bacterium]|nr:tRNA (adenosine(37)-N6)-dimethylallyltransferase MiaA [Ruminococcus sp.]MCM1274702.1 tRNA (adenosine(37)-N6)-dimethylallyltransferase MiaA [Lachnospiraceae bacterium]
MNKVIVVCGPTASGKTALAVELAERYDGEVVSADSMQIYTDMDIASAKATPEEQRGVPHHLIGFLEPTESFSVADYVGLCDKCVRDILSRGKTPIICGGTGLYISSFVDNLTFDDSERDLAFREEMRRFAEENGNAALLEKLREVDPETAETLHENNVGRIIRALEVYKTAGHTISQAKAMSRQKPSPYEFIMITIDFEDRERLRERINKRVDAMLERGLVEEARRCFEQPDRPTAAQAIGCKELYPYFRGERSLEECVEELKLRTRQYAKRQMTWFRRDKQIQHIIVGQNDEFSDIVEKAVKIIEGENYLK